MKKKIIRRVILGVLLFILEVALFSLFIIFFFTIDSKIESKYIDNANWNINCSEFNEQYFPKIKLYFDENFQSIGYEEKSTKYLDYGDDEKRYIVKYEKDESCIELDVWFKNLYCLFKLNSEFIFFLMSHQKICITI